MTTTTQPFVGQFIGGTLLAGFGIVQTNGSIKNFIHAYKNHRGIHDPQYKEKVLIPEFRQDAQHAIDALKSFLQ